MTTRLILCDGIIGAGKSTTALFLARYLHAKGIPVQHAGEDGALRIHALHRPPRNSIPPEYVPGEPLTAREKVKLTPEAFAEESLKRWRALAQEMASSDEVLVTDGHLFHGGADQLFLLDVAPQLIEEYIAQVLRIVSDLDPFLLHLIRQETRAAVREICQTRGPAWTRHQVDWKVASPYGKRNHYQGFDGLVRLFSDFSTFIERTAKKLPGRIMQADVSNGDYRSCYKRVLKELGLPVETALGVATLTKEGGDITLMGETDAPAPFTLAGQETIGKLYLRLCWSAKALEPLSGVTKIGGPLHLISNPGFQNLSALSKVRALDGDLVLYGNHKLESLDFVALEHFGGSLTAMSNPNLRRIGNVGSPEQLGGLWIANNPALVELSGLQTLRSVAGSVVISANKQLNNLSGLSALRRVGGDLEISYSNAIKDMDGLQKLEEIDGELKIIQNHTLQSISQLERLSKVRAVYILENPMLSTQEINGFLARLQREGFNGSVTVKENGSQYDPTVEKKWIDE